MKTHVHHHLLDDPLPFIRHMYCLSSFYQLKLFLKYIYFFTLRWDLKGSYYYYLFFYVSSGNDYPPNLALRQLLCHRESLDEEGLLSCIVCISGIFLCFFLLSSGGLRRVYRQVSTPMLTSTSWMTALAYTQVIYTDLKIGHYVHMSCCYCWLYPYAKFCACHILFLLL